MLNQLQEVVVVDVIILNYISQDIFCGMQNFVDTSVNTKTGRMPGVPYQLRYCQLLKKDKSSMIFQLIKSIQAAALLKNVIPSLSYFSEIGEGITAR